MIRIALGDGDGCFSNISFWKDYFNMIGCEFVDHKDDFSEIRDIDPMFPTIVCLNTRQRLMRAKKLAEKNITHVVYFIRQDDTVHNCPSSVYRLQWLKLYWEKRNVKFIVWKKDLLPNSTDEENLKYLAEMLCNKKISTNDLEKIGFIDKLPARKRAYDLSRKPDRKTFLLIGVSPHIIDPYRKSDVMDYLTENFNVIFPHFETKHFTLPKRDECFVKFYKVEGIFEAIRMIQDGELPCDGIIFSADAFDLPGKFAFPIIKEHLHKCGITEYNKQKVNNNLNYIDVTTGYSLQAKTINEIKEFAYGIK